MTALNVFRSFDQEATSPGLLGRSVVQLTPKSLINEFYYSKVESFKLRKTGSKTCNLFCKIDGWCSGGNTCLPLMWPGFQSRRRRHMWVLSLLLVLSVAPRDFSPSTPVFSSPQKPAFSNSNSTRNQLDEEPLSGYATSKSLLIFFILLHLRLKCCGLLCRYCPKCKAHREATKQLSVWRLPEILIIHLKRFSFRNILFKDKITKLVEFPLRWVKFRFIYTISNHSPDTFSVMLLPLRPASFVS